MSQEINQNVEPLFIFEMPDDEVLANTISVQGEKGERGDPTKLSELENDTGFITASTSSLANYYDKTATDQKLGQKLDEATFDGYEIPSDFFTGDETVSGNGNSITLANTAAAELKDIIVYGDTEQNGTPTPASPISVQVATGTQTITVSSGLQSQEYTLSLGDIELCKIGSYRDYIYNNSGAWYIHKEIGRTNLGTDATEWSALTTDTSGYSRWGIKVSQTDVPSNTSSETMQGACSHFACGTRGQTYGRNEVVALGSSSTDTYYKSFNLYISSIAQDTVHELKNWLVENEPLVYYPSTDPTDAEITDATLVAQLNALAKAYSYNGATAITISGSIAAHLSVVAFKNNWAGTISGINKEIDSKADSREIAQKPFYFDSVAEMKAANLRDGDMAVTTGYYGYNDGGAAKYKILDNSYAADNGSVINLNNGLQAVLIVDNNTINVKQFGAKGDGSTDDSTAIKNAFAFNGNNKSTVEFVDGATYVAKDKIYIYSNTTVELNGCTIKDGAASVTTTDYNDLRFMNNTASITVAGYGALSNFIMRNGTLDGNVAGVMFALLHAENCKFENIYFNKALSVTHVFDMGGCRNITIKNCDFKGCGITNSAHYYREVIQPDYASYAAMPYWGNDESIAFDDLPSDNITVDGCSFAKNDSDTYFMNGVGTHSIRNTGHSNITIKNCKFHGCQHSSIRFRRVTNLVIDNNEFYGSTTGRTDDHFMIDVRSGDSASYDNFICDGITITNNKFAATETTDDQIFIGIKGLNATYPFKNITVIGNTYTGTAEDEANRQGCDFAHFSNLVDVIVKNNIVNKAKHFVFKPSGDTIAGLKIEDNELNNTLRLIRGGGAVTEASNKNIEKLVICNNTIQNPRGAINTSSFRVELGIDGSSDITVGGGSTNVAIPLVVKDGYPLYIDSSNRITLPSYARNVRVSAFIKFKTTNSGTLNSVNLCCFDKTNSTFYDRSYNSLYASNDNAWRTVIVPDLVLQDKDLVIYYDSASDLLWRDGRFYIILRVVSTQPIVISHELADTKVVIEGF